MKSVPFVLCALAGLAPSAFAQVQGPSTQQTPQFLPSDPASRVRTFSIASNGNGVTAPDETFPRLNGAALYRLVGVPDGAGILRTPQDVIDGTFTFIMNHEAGANAGIVRDHGSRGAFVSLWKIRGNPGSASFLQVVGARDLADEYMLYRPGTGYETYNAASPMPAYTNNVLGTGPAPNFDGIGRHCAGDLAPPSAFKFGNFGTDARIYLNGEEIGNPGRAFAYVVTGPGADTAWELPVHGDYSWENSVASPFAQLKTIVVGTDDSTQGNVYVYVGTKTDTGNDIERAGLTNGKVYAVGMTGTTVNASGQNVEDRPNILGNAASGPVASKAFTMIDMGDQTNTTGSALQSGADALGQMNFLRPEDQAWDPCNPERCYFVTTDSFTGNSRLWAMDFTDIAQPELGGVISMVGDGSVPASFAGGIVSATGLADVRMMDNIVCTSLGQVLIQEDVGNNARLGRIWLYDPASDRMTEIALADASRYISGGANFVTQDEESSGIVDARKEIGPGWYVLDNQSHYGIAGELIEGSQILAAFIPGTFCYGDCNADNALTVGDFGCFQGKYVLGDLYADCNLDGAFSVADFGCFQGKYVLGCPTCP
ncbi:MAG: hypothetical protein ACKVU4_10905 [Phycisphaerales bacterium]